MSEIVDRLKAALNETWQTHGQSGHLRAAPLTDDMAAALTRAAIEALRDVECLPMLLAGKNALFSCSEDPTIEAARDCSRAMLDAALIDIQP